MIENSDDALRDMFVKPEDWTQDALIAAKKELSRRSLDVSKEGQTPVETTSAAPSTSGSTRNQVSQAQAKAEAGEAESQCRLAIYFYEGKHVARDPAEAARWYRKAAEQGHPEAQYRLGLLYDGGEGVTEDSREAMDWYKKAASQGHSLANDIVGSISADESGPVQKVTITRAAQITSETAKTKSIQPIEAALQTEILAPQISHRDNAQIAGVLSAKYNVCSQAATMSEMVDVFEIVTDVYTRVMETGIYGDLFVTADQLVYSQLVVVKVPKGGLAGVADNPVKGLLRMRGLDDSGWELMKALKEALESAGEFRKRRWGLSIEARTRQEAAVVMARDRVRSIRLRRGPSDTDIIEVDVAEGEPFVMWVFGADNLYDRLQLWRVGKPVQVAGDRQGVEQKLPLPIEILQWVQGLSTPSNIDPEVCSRATNAHSYCKELAEQLKNLAWPARELVSKAIRKTFEPLAANRLGWAMTNAPWGKWVEPAGFTSCFAIFSLLSAEFGGFHPRTLFLCVLLITAVLLCLSLTFIAFALEDRRRNMQCARILSPPSNSPAQR